MTPTLLLAATAAPRSPSFWQLTKSGGPVMIPIALLSVLALAFALERAWALRGARLGRRDFGRELTDALRLGGPDQALLLCRRSGSALAQIYEPALRRMPAPNEEVEKAVEDAGASTVRRLTSSLRPLVVISTLAPLLGLLGTVWGIILAFQEIGRHAAMGKPEQLADGISQALVTTAAGLVIAIPTQAAYYWLKSRIERFVTRLEQSWLDFEQGLRGPALAAAALAAAPAVAVAVARTPEPAAAAPTAVSPAAAPAAPVAPSPAVASNAAADAATPSAAPASPDAKADAGAQP